MANLTTLTDGVLELRHAPHLKDLTGLEKLEHLKVLDISEARELESLEGPTLPVSMSALRLGYVDLRDQQPLDVVEVGALFLDHTGLRDLTAFASLNTADSIYMSANFALESLTGLGDVFNESLVLDHNVSLQSPGSARLRNLRSVKIAGSPLLSELPVFERVFPVPPADFAPHPLDMTRTRLEELWLEDCGALTLSAVGGWRTATVVVVTRNASLRHVDFADLQFIDYLSIADNPALGSVSTNGLSKLNVFELVNNPGLPTSSFDGVRHLDMTASGNAVP